MHVIRVFVIQSIGKPEYFSTLFGKSANVITAKSEYILIKAERKHSILDLTVLFQICQNMLTAGRREPKEPVCLHRIEFDRLVDQ